MKSLILNLIARYFPAVAPVTAAQRTTVDSVMATLNKTITDLQAVQEAKRKEQEKFSEEAALATSKSNEAQREAVRAEIVQQRLSALIA